ncbi:CYTH domain-containing protein [Lentibacillus amyloliquefaciens]|uniref:Adenylate cyclase n=1 Tax=Lentibacillus amyloliquefaciens TaxID=1472767 RepID=A0A0U4F4W3_9BACI|nr:CYTH domain-containing protein [Lentibacillus amyloliquefaciens]ALX48630.1 adenylate cyclase [Lentibacillus amyloliquefaciens]
MSQEIEIEYKNLLIKDEFDRLLKGLPFPEKGQSQTNHYFETDDFSLKKQGCALRIREKNGTYTLTLKEPHSTGLLETHDTLTEQEARAWINENQPAENDTVKRIKEKGIAIKNLIYLGSLTTKRRELSFNHSLLVLDYSTYHGHDDYELEIEAPSEMEGKKTMQAILTDFDINKRKTPNKIQRFFDTIDRH